MSRTKSSFINASAGAISKIIIILVTFVSKTIFIYTLGVEYLGVSSLFTSILTMLSLVELGFATAITYDLYKPLSQKDNRKLAALMKFYKHVYNIIGVIIFIIGVALIPFLNEIVTGDIPNVKENIKFLYFMYLINTVVSYFFVYKATLLEADQKKYITSIAHTAVTVIKTICNSVILILTKNFIMYLVIEILSTLLYNITITVIANKKYKQVFENKDAKLEKTEKKGIFDNVKATFLYKISEVVVNSTDNIIISRFLGTIMVGIYSNYYMIINQVLTFLLLIFNSITASVGNLAAEETNERQETVFKNMTFLSFLIYYVCSVLLFCCINPFITIWVGKEFLLDISIVTVLVLNFYTTGMLIPVSTFRTANGLFVQGKYRPLIMAILNVVISIVLVKQIGLIGVFLGTLLSRVFTLMWYDPLLVYKKAFNKSPKKYFIKYFIYTFILVITCFVVYLIGEIIPVNNMIIKLAINVMLSLIFTFVTIIVIFRKTEEYKYVKNIIDNFISRLKIKRGKMANEN